MNSNPRALKPSFGVFFGNSLSLNTEFARLSLMDFEISDSLAMIMVFVEYAQLISQCVLFNPSLWNDSTYADDIFAKIVIFIAKLLNPGYFFKQENTGTLTVLILVALICSTFTKLFLLSYMIYIAKNKLKSHLTLIQLWQWVFHLQGKMIYFFVSSFWVNIIFLIKNGSFDIFGIGKNATIAVSSILIAIEFVVAIALQIRYFYALPEKKLFSAKSNMIEIINLFQKFFIQILQLTFPTNTLHTDWIMSITNLCLSIFKSVYFFTRLPLYRIKALLFEGSFLAIVISMNLTQLMQALMRSLHSQNNILFLLISWILISLLAVAVSHSYLKKIIMKILNDSSPKFFIHKIIFIKELRKSQTMLNKRAFKNDGSSLLNMAINFNIHKILQSTENNRLEILNIEAKAEFNQLILNYLQYLADTFPKDSFTKLYLAYFHGLKLKSFANAIRYIKEINLLGDNTNKLTLSLLILKIQNISASISQEQKAKINLNSYVKNLVFTNKLEENIFSQTQRQIELYQHVISETPDLAKIFNSAQTIQRIRRVIEKDADFISQETSLLSPLLLYADYHLKINHSIKNYFYFQKLYQMRFQKYSKYFDQDELNEYNAYQPKTAFVILETQKQNYGKIVYCSRSFQDIFTQFSIGTNISSYISPSLRNSFILQTLDKHSQELISTYGYSQDGYLIPINIFKDIFPILTKDLYIMMIIRPIPLSADYLLVRENGDIESLTKNIAQELGLSSPLSTLTNLKSISQELAKINQAFNLMADASPSFQNHNSAFHFMSEEEARELVRLYSGGGGKVIELSPLSLHNSSKSRLLYNCSFQVINSRSASLKLITLKQINTRKSQDSEIHLTEGPKIDTEIHSEDEKQPTLVPLETMPYHITSVLSVRDSLAPTFVGETFQTMEDHCLSPKSYQGLLIKRPKSENKKELQIQDPIINDHPQEVISIGSSQISRRSSKKQKIEEAFRVALTTKYYHKSWLCLFFMFYLGIAAIFGIEMSAKVLVDNDFSNFSLKKEIFTDAQSRNFLLLASQIAIRMVLDYENGTLNIGALGETEGIGDELLQSAKNQVFKLEIVNSNIIKNSNFLERSIQQILFYPNVRISNSEQTNTLKLNTLQATSSVIESALKLFGYIDQDQNDLAASQFSTLTKNALNDLLVETENISTVSLESVKSQIHDITRLLVVFLIQILAWVLCLMALFAFTIYRLYQEEKTNMLAIIKLNRSVIKNILHEMNSFQQKLFDHGNEVQNNKDHSLSIKETRQEIPKNPKFSGIRKRYVIYFVRLFFFAITIAILVIVNSLKIQKSLKNFQKQQTFVLFAYETKVATALSLISITELLSSNNTSEIRNQSPLAQVKDQIQALQSIRINAYENIVSAGTAAVTSEFNTLMFGDACGLIKEPVIQIFCDILSDYGKSSGLIYLLNTLEDVLSTKQNQYLTSNKTTKALAAIQADQLDLLTSIYQLLTYECDLSSLYLDQEFEQLLGNAQSNRNWLFGVFTFLLVMQGFLFWITVLSKLKKANAQFKSVLQVFPSRLVLSNYLLKKFLVQTSKGSLDLAIKSDL